MATKTVVASGANGSTTFASLTAWLASLPATITEPEIVELEAFDLVDSIGNAGWPSGMSATNYIEIRAKAGHEHLGVVDSGARWRRNTIGGFPLKYPAWLRVRNVQIKYDHPTGGDSAVSASAFSGASSLVRFENCTILSASSADSWMVNLNAAALNFELLNCVFSSQQKQVDSRGVTSIKILNCTSWTTAAVFGFLAENTAEVRNTYAGSSSGSATPFHTVTTNPTGSHNAASNGTATTYFTNSINNVAGTSVFTAPGSNDFSLIAATALVNAGTTVAAVTSSISGVARPQGAAYDIGAFEYSLPTPIITGPTGAAGAASITINAIENGNAVGTWTATNSESWSLTGTDAALLSITGGVVTKATGNFDFEAKASYSFNVVNGSASQGVTLNITNLPEPSSPTKSTPTATSAVIGFTSDVASGTAHAVLTLTDTAPSAAHVKAGQDHTGSSATTVSPADLTITTTGAKSFAAVTVVSGTTRYGWIVHEASGADSAVLATGALYPGTGRPVADVSVAGWVPSTGATVFGVLDEDTASDADFVTSPALSGTATTASMTLDKTYTAGTYSVKVRASVDTGTGNILVRMLNGSDVSQGATANQAITTTPTTYTLPITTTGDATRIRVEVTA